MKGENAVRAYTAAIYCRLSEEDRNKKNASDDSESIENQRSLLKGYCAENGWKIYDIYSDDDYTGSDRNRPAFRRMLADAQKKCFDVIVCKTLSRFTRELELVEKYINGLFPVWGIRFVSVVDNVDTAAKGNKKSRQIYGMVNEWFLEDMSDNIRAVLTDKRRNGRFIGAFAPFGYKKDPDSKGHLVIDEDAAST
ncbi:MAG: recombinase family protein, partial [Oscillospiraceae bacterium]|nr:recombinase family protein [Oscillospiraceae bacterium]